MSALDKKYFIKLDTKLSTSNDIPNFSISDCDTSDMLIRITNENTLVNLTDVIVLMVAISPNSSTQADFLEVKKAEEGLIYCDLKESFKNIQGTWKARIMCIYQDEKIVTSTFSYNVISDEFVTLNEQVLSDDRYPILTEIISRLSIIELNEKQRQNNELSRIEAEKQREIIKQQLIDQVNNLISDTNLKVDNSLLENSNNVTKLISDTEIKIDNYKIEKDLAIDHNLEAYKTNTTQDINTYKNNKDVEINQILDTYKTSTTKNIEDYKVAKDTQINQSLSTYENTINTLKEDFNEAVVNVTNGNESATNSEIVLARKGEKSLRSKIDKIDEQFNTIQSEKADKTITDILENKKIDRNEQNSISMGMLTQELKASMTNGKVAIVGTDSVGFTQFSKTIQNDITSIMDISPTTYNQFLAEVTLNKVTIGTSVYYKHIVLNVSEGERYDVTVNCTNNVNVKYIIYCDDELNVTGTDITNITTGSKQNKVLTIPTGTTKMYINTEATSGSISIKKYVYSPIATKKELTEIQNEVSQITNNIKSLIVLNCTNYDRPFNNVNGIATQGTSIYYNSIVADVVENEKVYVSFRTASNASVEYVYFVDDNYKIISSYFTGYNSTNVFNDSELTVPSGATKIIVNSEVTYNNLYVKAFRFLQLATSNELSLLDNRVVELENKNLNIPSYYNSYLNDKINAIKLLEKNYGCEGESFIFITDLHVDDNTMISPALIQKIVNETNVKNIICGGDLIPAFNQTEDSILRQAYEYIDSYKKINGAKFYTVTANHDLLGWVGSDTSSNQIKLSDNIRYSILYKNMEDKVKFGNLKQDYFYFDNEVQKIRYVCLGLFNVDTVTSEEINAQIDWLKTNVLNGIDSNWTLFLFGHAGLTTITGDGWSNTSQTLIDLKSAIENIKISYNIAFYMAGHLHKDLTVLENGIRHISTACDAYYSDDGIARTLGTTNEVCFDVVCTNKKTRKINCVRIGAGSNREFSY